MEEIREEVPISPNTYNPYQIPPSPLAPGGPKIRDHNSPCQTPPTLRPTWRGLFRTIDAVFRALNATHPNLTQDCWICLNPEPPYYIGLGVDTTLGFRKQDVQNRTQTEITENKSVCLWGFNPKLTLGDLQGQGLCIRIWGYNIKLSPYQNSCAQEIILLDPGDAPSFLVTLPGT
jgi:hypothetical protein